VKAGVEWEKGKRPKNPWLGGFCGVSFEAASPLTALSHQIKRILWPGNGTREEQGARWADYRRLLKFLWSAVTPSYV